MSKRIDTIPNSDPLSASYPVGSFKNSSAPLVADGTPLLQEWANDIQGLLQRLMLESGKTYSDAADTVLVSQYYDSFTQLFSMKYDTVADMIVANLQVGSFVKTKGYLVAGDLGGANYQIVSPSTGTDDGGSFIDLTNTNQAQLIPDVRVNSKQFGAVGNGSTDDTTAIQNLIDAFNIIDINSQSLVTGLTLNSKMDINIDEILSIANGNVFTATGKDGIIISFRKNGVLFGDDSLSDIGILFDGCSNCEVNNPIMTQYVDAGISIINGSTLIKINGGAIVGCESGIVIEDSTTLYNTILDVALNTNTFGLKVLGASNNNFNSLSCVGNVNAGIFLQDKTGGCHDNVFNGCKCNDGTGANIAYGGVVINPLVATAVPHNNIFIGQICNDNASHGILMLSLSDSPGDISGYETRFDSPVCKGNAFDGILLERANDMEITNAICNDNIFNGISTKDCDGIRISGGKSNNNGATGINHESIRTLIDGATITNNGTNGIRIRDGVETSLSHRIINCQIDNNPSGDISIVGANSVPTSKAFDCTGFVTDNRGSIGIAASVTVIPHGLSATPARIFLTASETVLQTPTTATLVAIDATNISVKVENVGGGLNGTESLYWETHLY